jgi:hypothetical protein
VRVQVHVRPAYARASVFVDDELLLDGDGRVAWRAQPVRLRVVAAGYLTSERVVDVSMDREMEVRLQPDLAPAPAARPQRPSQRPSRHPPTRVAAKAAMRVREARPTRAVQFDPR